LLSWLLEANLNLINQLRSTIYVGLAFAAICVLCLFIPGLTDHFVGPMSREVESELFLGSMIAHVSLAFSMTGFGLIRFLGLARMSRLRYLVFGIYFAPLLIDLSLMAFIWIDTKHKLHELQERGLKVT